MKRKATLEVEYGVMARGMSATEWERLLGRRITTINDFPTHIRITVISDEAVELQP